MHDYIFKKKKIGHNGLVAANYLAKFSKKKLNICMLEQRHVIGGAAVTEELIPGFKFSRASYLLSLFRPIILKDLSIKNISFHVNTTHTSIILFIFI